MDVVSIGFGDDEESRDDDVVAVDCLMKCLFQRKMHFHRECCDHGRMF